MSRGAPLVEEAGKRLRHIESLLDEALDDLVGKKGLAPCSRSTGVLAEAVAELESFARWWKELGPPTKRDLAALLLQVDAILPRIGRAERLLVAAAEFYREWCAAGRPSASAPPLYQAEGWPPGPALLAFEG